MKKTLKKTKSHVLLVKPEPAHNCFSLEMALSTEPLELEYIAAMLKKEPLSSVNGLCYVRDGKWLENELKPFSINLLPIPDRSLSNKRMEHYRYLDVSPLALLKTSTSCPYQCSFCYGRSLNCGTYTVRDLDKVIEEIKTIESPNIQIVDDDFLFHKKRLLEFARRLKEVGFRYIMVGLEATNNSLLEAYQKKTSLDTNIQCIKILKKLNIHVVGLFIVDIHFTSRDFRNMRRFIKQSGISYAGVSIFTPIPGTGLFEQYKDQLLTDNMEKWDFMHLVLPPVHMTRFRFYLEYYRLVMLLFSIAEKKGIYRFLTLSDYKKIFWNLIWKDA